MQFAKLGLNQGRASEAPPRLNKHHKTKGYDISEKMFLSLNSSQNNNKKNSAVDSKMGQIKKIKALYYISELPIIVILCLYFFI